MFLTKALDMKTSKSYAESQLRVRPLASAQIRAARSLIRWTADELAAASALSVATIRRAELKESETALTAANDLAIRRALEVAGVEFIDENGGGPGVRLRKRQQKKA
jgi:transcriptional regulator with XRE-family HTH domain